MKNTFRHVRILLFLAFAGFITTIGTGCGGDGSDGDDGNSGEENNALEGSQPITLVYKGLSQEKTFVCDVVRLDSNEMDPKFSYLVDQSSGNTGAYWFKDTIIENDGKRIQDGSRDLALGDFYENVLAISLIRPPSEDKVSYTLSLKDLYDPVTGFFEGHKTITLSDLPKGNERYLFFGYQIFRRVNMNTYEDSIYFKNQDGVEVEYKVKICKFRFIKDVSN